MHIVHNEIVCLTFRLKEHAQFHSMQIANGIVTKELPYIYRAAKTVITYLKNISLNRRSTNSSVIQAYTGSH